MKNAKRALFVAATLSLLAGLEEINNFVSQEITLRQYKVLGFQDVNFVAASQSIAHRHLIMGGWFIVIAGLVIFAIYSLRKLN